MSVFDEAEELVSDVFLDALSDYFEGNKQFYPLSRLAPIVGARFNPGM